VLAIVAGILLVRHRKTADDLLDSKTKSEDRESLVAAAVQFAERIMRKIEVHFQNQRPLFLLGFLGAFFICVHN